MHYVNAWKLLPYKNSAQFLASINIFQQINELCVRENPVFQRFGT